MEITTSALDFSSSNASTAFQSTGKPEESIKQIQHLANNFGPQLLVGFVLLLTAAAFASRARGTKQPPSLSDPIPYIFNTLQFLRNNDKFMARAK